MSRTLWNRFSRIFSGFLPDTKINNSPELILVTCVLIGGNFCYAIGTKEEKEIVVSKKYQFTKNGISEFMLIDKRGKHYNVNNSVWYWKWDSIEDWCSIEENKKIKIKSYGWRVPVFGMFPNIIETKNYGLDVKPVMCCDTGCDNPVLVAAG
jgi:hypothetical protein